MDLTHEEKKILIKTARTSIESIFNGNKPEPPDYESHPVLMSKAGAFVTLTIGGDLRGCIGYIISENPLFETVWDAAQSAAISDPRFSPLNENELDKIEIEISVLSEPYPMKNYEEIELGKHGLICSEMGRRGLLLPQVPIEHGMTKEDFLTAICRKTGIPEDLWQKKVLNIDLFTANVFSEKELEN